MQKTKPVKRPSNRAQCPADIVRISRQVQGLVIPMLILLNGIQRKSQVIQRFQPLLVSGTLTSGTSPVGFCIEKSRAKAAADEPIDEKSEMEEEDDFELIEMEEKVAPQ